MIDYKFGIGRVKVPLSHVALLFLAISVFTSMALYSAMNGPRGWDQYWYIADVESLAEGRGVVTNNIFPASIQNADASLQQPFIHNILNVYLAAPAAAFLGGHWGWIATNLFSVILATLLIYYLVSRVTRPLPALFASLLFLHMPLTFWLASQPLSEASTFMLSAAFITAFALPGDSYKKHALALALAGLLFFCRKSFMPLLFLVPLLFLFNSRSINRAGIVRTMTLLTISVMIFISARILFPSSVSWDISDILMSAMPGERTVQVHVLA